MNVQSMEAFNSGMTALRSGLGDLRESRDRKEATTREDHFRTEMMKMQIAKAANEDALAEKLKGMELTAGESRSVADRISRERIAQLQVDAERKARSGEAFWRAQTAGAADNPTGTRGDLLAAEADAARANAVRLQQQNAMQASTLGDDLGKVDEWARSSFRANQSLQQAQASGDAEAVAVAQARIARLQSLGQKYGSEKPEQRMVKVRMPFIGPNGKEAGFREWEEPFDPQKHNAGTANFGGQPQSEMAPLNSVEALKQRMAAGVR